MKALRLLTLLLAGVITGSFSSAQTVDVYPPHWWVGMKNPMVQLMIHGNEIGKENAGVTLKYPGVKVQHVHPPENQNYLFIDLTISPQAKPGKVQLSIQRKNAKPFIVDYELKSRRSGKGKDFAQGVTSSDFIYLLMPDRFSNGDPSNDRISGMKDQTLNRDSMYYRHGGDLQGVINHLDYLKELGVTTVWMTPVLENDRSSRTEHGYAFTNHYKIDPRLGGETMYKKLSDELHKRGMKLIQDAVYNHIDIDHFTVKDTPMKDWLHEWPVYTNTTYKDQPLFDSYASAIDKKRMSDGWFTHMMPDLNQSNPFVAHFLIQHALWSVEEFGVDGWRIDTYIYNDLPFMNQCNQALLDEYPKISMFGETWVHGTVNQSFFAQNNLDVPFKSNLPGTTDFQTNLYGIAPALNQPFGWSDGVNKLYQTLSNDIVYKDPMREVIFLDNHDMTRFLSQVGEDVEKLKMGIAWLLTCRGIPQMYYGTEILMKGVSHPDGLVRSDFQGGWAGDKNNKFTREGRTDGEEEIHQLTQKLANFRLHSTAIKTGKYMHYVPQDGVYVYFRYDGTQTIMCIMNTSAREKEIDFTKYAERTNGFAKAKDVVSDEIHDTGKILNVGSKKLVVLELLR